MHYRDDQASLEARRDDLRLELAEMERKAAALQSIARDQEAAERELAAVEARLAHQTARRLPLLDRISIAAPCDASWDAMAGDGRVRFCGSCEKNVYNLSAMAREEAESFLAARDGSVCVRLYQRADGTVMTSDCSVGVKRRRRRQTAIALAGVGAMAATAALAVEAMWTQGKAPAVSAAEEPVRMGKVSVAHEPQEPFPGMPMMGEYAEPAPPPKTASPEPPFAMMIMMGDYAEPAPTPKTAPSAVKPPKAAPTAQPVRPTMGKPTMGEF